ncbi:VF530 family protein [Pedobacter gandavensis]|uniref:DNA-binding protein VF530 n=1 Tax=Pedobacter gandavensis TaxID=2679963 RepID=A0ABR6EWH1_9SPHI|nr:VF530 family protein [Pedobacter gandavensis]MBB2149589.1 DNA-binding protein VF530 [Pedobacter gandavensis]
MTESAQPNNPLHGKTLEFIVKQLVWHYDWPELGRLIRIECFLNNPSLKSSLKFLRKTDWARKKVEKLYLDTFH